MRSSTVYFLMISRWQMSHILLDFVVSTCPPLVLVFVVLPKMASIFSFLFLALPEDQSQLDFFSQVCAYQYFLPFQWS